MFDLTQFTLADMTECGAALRKLGDGGHVLEDVAGRLVHYLYDNLGDPRTGERACALVRFFKTHPYDDLDAELRAFARRLLEDEPPPDLKCLTLVASVGDRPAWCDRHGSAGHQAIPLASPVVLARLPMIAQLVRQFGLDDGAVIRPDPAVLLDLAQRTYNVFHVAEARGSPYVPAQDKFVVPCGIRSVLGFGGVLSDGSLFAVTLFARVPIPRATADFFRTLALSAKLAVLPFVGEPLFAESTAVG
jgi:hypothetical protein